MDPDCAMLPLACPGYIWGDEGVETDCGNFDDDDWDGWIDCLDPDCANTAGCEPGTMPLGGPCTAHSDCEDGAFAGQPMCLMTQPGSVLAGTCTQTCKLDDPVATCSQDIDGDGVDDGYRCIDTGFGGGMGLCLPACVYDSDCLVGPFAGGAEQNHCEDTGLGLSIGVCRTPECAGTDDCDPAYYCAESVGRCRPLTDTIDEWMPVQIDEVPIVAGYRVTWDPNAGTATARPLQTWEYDGQDPRFVRDDLIRLGADLGQLKLTATAVAAADCQLAAGELPDGGVVCLDVLAEDATGLGIVAAAVEAHAAPANPRLPRLTWPIGDQVDLSEVVVGGDDPRLDPVWETGPDSSGGRRARVILPTPPGEIELDIWVRAQVEVCGDAEDNDEDSLVDEGCRTGDLGDTCGSDFDCGSGICDAGTCAPPHLGDWRTVGVYDVTLATPNSETLIPSKDVIDWPSGADPYLPQGEPLPLLIRHPLGLTPEDCDVDDVYPYDRNGVTCLPLELEWQGTQQDNLPVWVELTTEGAGELLYTGLLSGGPWPELGDLDKLPNAPTGGRSLRGRIAPPGVQSRPATFYFPDLDSLTGSAQIVVRTFVPAPGPAGVIPTSEWTEQGEAASPAIRAATEAALLCGSALPKGSSVYRVSDVDDFSRLLAELDWTPEFLARTFTNLPPDDHNRHLVPPESPDFSYLKTVFGARLDAAFPVPEGGSLRALIESDPWAAFSVLRSSARGWAELLRPTPDGKSDSYWGFRAIADHSSLGTHAQEIRVVAPGYRYFQGARLRGTQSDERFYVLEPSAQYRIRQFTTAMAVPYYGPPPLYSDRIVGNRTIEDRISDGSATPAYEAWPAYRHSPDNQPERRRVWGPLQFVGASHVAVYGCDATVTSDASTDYQREAWIDVAESFDLPMCVRQFEFRYFVDDQPDCSGAGTATYCSDAVTVAQYNCATGAVTSTEHCDFGQECGRVRVAEAEDPDDEDQYITTCVERSRSECNAEEEEETFCLNSTTVATRACERDASLVPAQSCSLDGKVCRDGRCVEPTARARVRPILEPQTIQLIAVEDAVLRDLELRVPLATLRGRYSPVNPYAVGLSEGASGELTAGSVWNDLPSFTDGSTCMSAGQVRAVAPALAGRPLGVAYESGAAHGIAISNSRGVSLHSVRVLGGYDGLLVGGDAVPYSMVRDNKADPLTDWFAWSTWVAEQVAAPGEAPWRFGSTPFLEPVCAKACATFDVDVEDSWFVQASRNTASISYARRTAFSRSVLSMASVEADVSASPPWRWEQDGWWRLIPETDGSESYLTSTSIGLDAEPNGSRRLPRVHTTTSAQRWWYGNGTCERYRAGDLTVFDSMLVGNLGKAASFQAHWGNFEDVRIVHSTLIGPASDPTSPQGETLFASGSGRTDIVDSFLWSDDRGLSLWTDGADGLFVGNTIRLTRDAILGRPAVRERPLDSHWPCVAEGTPGLAGYHAAPYGGPSPYAGCVDAHQASSGSFNSVRRVSGVLTAFNSTEEVPGVFYRRGYDRGWPLLPGEEPVRVVSDNAFVVDLTNYNNASGRLTCGGDRITIAADIVEGNRFYVSGACVETNGDLAGLDIEVRAPAIAAYVRDNVVSAARAWPGTGGPRCGDGTVDAGEDCDGSSNCTDSCGWDMSNVGPAGCGDGVLDPETEECDVGAAAVSAWGEPASSVYQNPGCNTWCSLTSTGAANVRLTRVTRGEISSAGYADITALEIFNGNTFPISAAALRVDGASLNIQAANSIAFSPPPPIPPFSAFLGLEWDYSGTSSVIRGRGYAAMDPGLAAPVVSVSLEVVNLSGTVIGSHTVSTSELADLPSTSEPRTSWTYVPTDDGTGGWRLTWDTTRGPQLPATLPEYRELVDGQLWVEPNMVEWRLLPEADLDALEGDPGVALRTVNLRADDQRATYEALAAGAYSAWDDGVTFPPSRFDGTTAGRAGGIPALCPEGEE
ncbi:MAG: hypothetical protein H6698_08475 [Myxococcales bacterium]|nr:hypothetical protein [Myxococcales bacterium]MCB9534325.1 hypothetical protein [Myxococcales bacterium]